jgi:hypothetical protein
MNKNMLAVALASLLVGGVAVAAYNSFRGHGDAAASDFATANPQAMAGTEGDVEANGAIEGSKLEYADVGQRQGADGEEAALRDRDRFRAGQGNQHHFEPARGLRGRGRAGARSGT